MKRLAIISVSSGKSTDVMEHVQTGYTIVKSTCLPIFELRSDSTEEKDGYEMCKRSWLNEYLTSDQYNSSPFSNDLDMFSNQSHSSSTLPPSSCFDEFIDTRDEFFESVISSRDVLLPPFAEKQHFADVKPSAPPSPGLTHNRKDSEMSSPGSKLSVDYEYLPAACLSDTSIISSRQPLVDNGDSFHQMYTQRMKFFDVLYQERSYGFNAILDANLASPSRLGSKTETKWLLKSLKSDLELVYVAELCLTWEALHCQYWKVKALGRLFVDGDVSRRFQKFQIILERSMEDEKLSQGKRSISSYNHRRCQLQVPHVTGIMELEDGNCSMRGEAVKASEVLVAIEKCIRSFWAYIETDSKTSFWNFKANLWSHSHAPVEDPKDLGLLYDLSKALHKKEHLVKHMQGKGKKKGMLKRKVKPVQVECETMYVLFSMIDLKLVEKVLKMSIISTSHLKWCREKLRNIEFRDGKLCTSLFPSS